MDLQSAFYIIGIIFMLLWIIVLILMSVVLWELYTVIKNAPARIEAKIDAKIDEMIEGAKGGLMGTIGIGAATFVINRIKGIFSRD